MNQSFVTMASWGYPWKKQCNYFCIVPCTSTVQGSTPLGVSEMARICVVYMQKWQCNETITDCGDKRQWVPPPPPPPPPRSEGLLAGICSTESQSPCYSQKPGPWLQMTGFFYLRLSRSVVRHCHLDISLVNNIDHVKVRGATLPFRHFTGKQYWSCFFWE